MRSIFEHLSLLTRLHGNAIAAEALAAQTNRADDHVDFSSLAEVLRSHGFDNQLSQRSLDDIPSLAVPLVLMLSQGESVVVTSIEGQGRQRQFTICLTHGVTRQMPYADLAQRYLGYCWFVKPRKTADIRSDLPEYHLPRAWFWKVIWRFRSYYYQVILASFTINFLALISSFYVMNVYDRVIPNKTYETLWALSIGVMLAIAFEFIAKLIRAKLTDIAGKKADLIISAALFRRVMALRLAERPASAGSYANNLRDFESVRDFMTSASLLTLVDFPFILLFIAVIALVGGKLALVPLAIIPVVIIVGFLIQKPLARYTLEAMREASQRQGLAVEAIEGIETLKANNATNWAQRRWDAYTAKTAATAVKQKDLTAFTVNFSVAMQQLNTVLLVLVGTYLIHAQLPENRITMGALIASVILSGRALAPLAQVAALAARFQQAKAALEGINKIVERPIERDPQRQYVTLDALQGSLSFQQLTFRYAPDGKDALHRLNLHIRPGEKVGILGRIGSGKSTLLKLGAGLYHPKEGHVLIDNVDSRQMDPHYLRNQIALLSQSPRLFMGTLRENLDLGRSDGFSTDQQLLTALNRFDLIQLVHTHPRGLDMPLGEDGLGLSGGQKQIVALARLTLRDPRIVLLDEPTASLDQDTEIQALQALAQWAQNRTLVVVTHRPQVLQIVQRIVVVDNGRVVMDGPRDAVLTKLSELEQAHNQPDGAPSIQAPMATETSADSVTGPQQPHAASTEAGGTEQHENNAK